VRVEELCARQQQIGIRRQVIVIRRRFGGGVKRRRVLVLGQARRVQYLGELDRLLRRRAVIADSDGIEVERFNQRTFLVGRHEALSHWLGECLEALHVYPQGVLVALLGAVKGVLLVLAYAAQVAHCRLELDVHRRAIAIVATIVAMASLLFSSCLPC
jgi:hypothetical protein